MLDLAAPGDTWGISGPDFLTVYLGALAVFFAAAIVIRLRVTRSDHGGDAGQPTPGEIAMLEGGRSRAMYASIAGLRAVGAVGTGARGALTVTGPVPPGMTRLDHAVHDAAGRGVRVTNLIADHRVASTLDELGAEIERSGWALDSTKRSSARLGGWMLLGLGGFGIVRMVAGIANDKAVGFIVVLAAIAFFAGAMLMRVPRQSAAGKRAIAQARRRHAHLAPSQAPAWSTYGMAGAAMGVALFGTSALWAADPAFAGEAGIRRSTDTGGSAWTGDSGGSGGGGSGGGGSGGGDSGGGGGCGGGGCGGCGG